MLYAFWGAVFVTGLVAFFWVISVVIKLDGVDTKPLEDIGTASGAFSQFLEKTKESFFGEKTPTVESPDSTNEEPISTSSPSVATSTTNYNPVVPLIATTTPAAVKIGTSSEVAN